MRLRFSNRGTRRRPRWSWKPTLQTQPESAVAQRLLFQIDAPLDVLFPEEAFEFVLAPDESLSSLSGTYLGEVIRFYGLARYNNIINPSRVVAGQTIRIPATPSAIAARTAQEELSLEATEEIAVETEALAATDDMQIALEQIETMVAARRFGAAIREAEAKGMMPSGRDASLLASAYAANARELQTANALHAGAQALRSGQLYLDAGEPREALEMLDLAVALTPGSTAARAMRDAARREVVEIEYREGVEAFGRNDLAAAIGHWDRALALNPDHRNSALNRSQAIELQRGQSATPQ